VAHHAKVLEVSAKNGQGMDAWVEHLRRLSGERNVRP
jgi:hypothetical protein